MEQVHEQVEEQKYLTIDELMPTWSAYLDLLLKDIDAAQEFKTENHINYLSADKCCVGEAWKWSDDYVVSPARPPNTGCNICDGFSFGKDECKVEGFGDVIRKTYSGKDWRQTPTVKAFVKHFNEAHVKP